MFRIINGTRYYVVPMEEVERWAEEWEDGDESMNTGDVLMVQSRLDENELLVYRLERVIVKEE